MPAERAFCTAAFGGLMLGNVPKKSSSFKQVQETIDSRFLPNITLYYGLMSIPCKVIHLFPGAVTVGYVATHQLTASVLA